MARFKTERQELGIEERLALTNKTLTPTQEAELLGKLKAFGEKADEVLLEIKPTADLMAKVDRAVPGEAGARRGGEKATLVVAAGWNWRDISIAYHRPGSGELYSPPVRLTMSH